MTTQERNILIAEAMGLVTEIYEGKLHYQTGETTYAGMLLKKWKPDEDAEQREMIEDWLIEQGIEIVMGRAKTCTTYHFYDSDDVKADIGAGCIADGLNISKSEAFLQAAAEYCLTLKNQK